MGWMIEILPRVVPVHSEREGEGLVDPESGMLEMGFLDHLEDLRWSLIKGFAGILVFTFRPGSKKKYEDAAQLPLKRD